MNVGKAIYGILSGTTAVTDIVGTKIFPEIAEQESAVPFVIYQLQSVQPEDTHDGPSKLDEVRVEVLCYDDAYNGAADLASAVRGALDRVKGTYNGVNVESVQFNDVDIEVEYDPRRYSQVLTFTFRIKRDDIEIALGTPVTGAQLGDLSDVNVSGVTDNQILSYDAATGTWVPAADAGGPDVLDDLSDVDVGEPEDGQMLAYQQGTWSAINQDEITLPILSVTGLQAELNTIPDSLDDLDDVKIVGTPSEGEALVYQSGFWSRGTAGASTLGDLDDVNTTGAGVGSTIVYNGSTWEISGSELPSDDIYYHNRYLTEAGTLRSGATATVELYYTAQADGDGLSESASSDTPTSGYDIRRKLYYAEKAQADPDTSGDWTQFTAIADNTTFANAKTALLAYLKERTGGTVPISLKMTWEEVTQAPAFTGLLNETYGANAEAAYSVRRLNGNVTECMVIRRASDSTTTTIGFDSNGNIDESAINTFCSGTTCTVYQWLDQSGNGNTATAAAQANEPTIYTGGAIVKENGRVAVDFDGTDDGMLTSSSNILHGSEFTAYLTLNSNNSATAIHVTGGSNANGEARYLYDNGGVGQMAVGYLGFNSGTSLNTYTENSQQLLEYYGTNQATSQSGTITSYSNGVGGNTYNSSSIVTAATNAGLGIGYDSHRGGSYADMTVQELIFYASDKSTDRTSIESNIGDYFTQNTPLLDTYTGAAAAYSLRKLRTAYSGSAIRVRRASDNTEQDIGFNVFGELDTVSLASFCSGTDGFVKTWYDQSGNGLDLTQTSTGAQFKVYDSSTGYLGELRQNGSVTYFQNNLATWSQPNSAFTVFNTQANNTNIFDGQTSTNRHVLSNVPATNKLAIYAGTDLFTTALSNGEYLGSCFFNGSSSSLYIDGAQKVSGDAGTGDWNFGTVGQRYTINTTLNQTESIKELIIYNSDQSSNRTNIEDNINTFYSIY